MTRGVEQIQQIVTILKLEHRRGDRNPALLLNRHPVGDCGPLLLAGAHRAGLFNCAGVKQQLFGQRRFAGIGMGNNRKGAPAGNLFG